LAAQQMYPDYFDEALICYTSLRENGFSDKEIFEKENGENIFSALTFMRFQIELGNYNYPIHKKLQPHFEHFKTEFNSNFKQLIDKELDGISAHNLYEMEMLIYFLTQVPTQLPEAKFSELMDRWKTLKPVYKANLEMLISARDELKSVFEQVVSKEVIGINLTDGNNRQDHVFNEVQPLLNLTGISTGKGTDLELIYATDIEKMMEKQDYIYKTVNKKRRVRNDYTDNKYKSPIDDGYKTERYKEQKIDRVETIEVFKNSINLGFPSRNLISNLPKHLPKQFLDKKQKDYTIEPWEMNRGESWIFALPQKWF
jgi:hypothetical protein